MQRMTRKLLPKDQPVTYCTECATWGDANEPLEERHDADCPKLQQYRAAVEKQEA